MFKMKRRDPKGIKLEEYIEKNRKGLSLDGVLGDEYRKHDNEIADRVMAACASRTEEESRLYVYVGMYRQYPMAFYDGRNDTKMKEWVIDTIFKEGLSECVCNDEAFKNMLRSFRNDLSLTKEYYEMIIRYMIHHDISDECVQSVKNFAASKGINIEGV